MVKKILVANRGEIAVRILRTVREMELESVAVYSDADRNALHVLSADEAIHLGAAEPAQSYLNIERILEAAKRTGADAIHPGYGFLSENPDFARAVTDAGLTFIGPSAEVMERLGDKTGARRLMAESGVPITPGMDAVSDDKAHLEAEAERIGFPVLVKATAGGGGKGMRVVHRPEELDEAVDLSQSEARAAFGNGGVYLEKYLERPRHVEIQILADGHGNAVHLFERECSIQRRHQKIIEETPSPALNAELREHMGAAAVRAVKAAGYVNAGTVEFLLDGNDFYFLEVNTRLQVEHPITEMVTGLDLVRRQIDIANGKALPFSQKDLRQSGHAIECRIYAEDASNGFMPSPGRLHLIRHPQGPGVRYDCGVRGGDEVPVNYDPILGKLIVHAETREAAIRRMIEALAECVVLGVRTSVEYLMDVLDSDAFRNGDTHTRFLEEHFADWVAGKDANSLAALAYALNERYGRPPSVSMDNIADPESESPWRRLGNWDIYK